ncbi:hypothetical protein, partial [Streptomyces cinnamoneus]|uniref:hypothetical protein n=1 Tax=Streptomyces cinnamoneus TaxID=53446 RepID=UPI0019603839
MADAEPSGVSCAHRGQLGKARPPRPAPSHPEGGPLMRATSAHAAPFSRTPAVTRMAAVSRIAA